MTDYEPYVEEPSERRPPPPLARLRPKLAWFATVLTILALSFLWVSAGGSEDPSLNVPADQLTPAPADPADPAAPPAEEPPADPAQPAP